MKVGLLVPQNGEDGEGGSREEIRAIARHAEAGGADSLWVADHLIYRPAGEPEAGLHEALTMLTALAAWTERVQVGSIVLATSFRSPGLLAKMAATIDELSAGRLILGLGCGWYEPEYRTFGFPFDHRVGRFEEALGVILPLLRGERVTVHGRWLDVEDAVLIPRPRRSPPILIAAKGERMLRLTARHADAWNTAWFGLPDARFAERRDALLAACEAEDRDQATLELTVGVTVRAPGADFKGPAAEKSLPLDASAIADALRVWAGEGVGHVLLGPELGTRATFDVALEGMARFRAGSRRAAGEHP